MYLDSRTNSDPTGSHFHVCSTSEAAAGNLFLFATNVYLDSMINRLDLSGQRSKVKGQGRCDLTKHIFGNSKKYNKFDKSIE